MICFLPFFFVFSFYFVVDIFDYVCVYIISIPTISCFHLYSIAGFANLYCNSEINARSNPECDKYIRIFKYIGHKYLFEHSFVSNYHIRIYSDIRS